MRDSDEIIIGKGHPTVFSKAHLKLSTDSDLVLKLDGDNEISGLEFKIAKFNVTINDGGNFYAGEVLPVQPS